MSVFVLGSIGSVWSSTEYLGLYMQGQKIGYSSYGTEKTTYSGKPASVSRSKTVMSTGLLGTALTINMDSATWSTPTGKPLRIRFHMSSAGRVQDIEAVFGTKSVDVAINNSGNRSTKTLSIPNGVVTDDPLSLLLATGSSKTTQSFYVFDPMTASFIKNDLKVLGPSKVTIKGKSVSAKALEVIDPRANMKVYVSAKGDFLKADGPMGISMLPETRAVAMGSTKGYAPSIDLAYSTSIRPDKTIENPASLEYLKLKITNKDLSRVPSGDHETITKEGDAFIIEIHPPRFGTAISATEAAKQQPEWIKPSMHLPATDPAMVSLAKKIVGNATTVPEISKAIQLWVNGQMQPNAGIGVLRDAREVLKSKEGVCRDYAILTATLLRAAGVPTRLCSGLVNWDGTFFYHAWDEVWDGTHWVGVDSTTSDTMLSAGHVKLAEGNVEDAFTFTFLEAVKVEVLDSRGR